MIFLTWLLLGIFAFVLVEYSPVANFREVENTVERRTYLVLYLLAVAPFFPILYLFVFFSQWLEGWAAREAFLDAWGSVILTLENIARAWQGHE